MSSGERQGTYTGEQRCMCHVLRQNAAQIYRDRRISRGFITETNDVRLVSSERKRPSKAICMFNKINQKYLFHRTDDCVECARTNKNHKLNPKPPIRPVSFSARTTTHANNLHLLSTRSHGSHVRMSKHHLMSSAQNDTLHGRKRNAEK